MRWGEQNQKSSMQKNTTIGTAERAKVHVSPGSAETLARGGGIANHDLIAYSLSIISAKKLLNRLMCVEVIVWYIIVVFLRHSVYDVNIMLRYYYEIYI